MNGFRLNGYEFLGIIHKIPSSNIYRYITLYNHDLVSERLSFMGFFSGESTENQVSWGFQLQEILFHRSSELDESSFKRDSQ